MKTDSYIENELEPLLCKMRTAKQKQLLKSHFLAKRNLYA